jgi:hypothetical protein
MGRRCVVIAFNTESGGRGERQFGARVELLNGKTRITRRVETPAENADQAKARMEKILSYVWPGWSVYFITKPHPIKP